MPNNRFISQFFSLFIIFCCVIYLTSCTQLSSEIQLLDGEFSVMNTISTLQFYGDKAGFHHGLDLQASAGTKFFAPVGGVVDTRYYYRIQSPYTYEVSIQTEDGYLWQFHHLDPASIPPEIEALAQDGGTVESGVLLGEIYDASSLGIFPHVHINLIDSTGYYQNPWQFLPPPDDSQAPTIRGIYIINDNNQVVSEIEKSGEYALVVDAIDIIPPSEIGQSVYALEVFICPSEEDDCAKPSLLSSVNFDQLPEQNDFISGAEEVYQIEPIVLPDGSQITNQIKPEQPRRFLFRFPLPEEIIIEENQLNLQVIASDFVGNNASESYIISTKP